MTKANRISIEVSASGRNDGTIEALYIHVSQEPVASTREIRQDVLLADYDKDGRLVGFEVLAPVRVADLSKLVDQTMRTPFRNFVKRAAPAEFVCA